MVLLKIFLKIKGQYVGKDQFGNRYYKERFFFKKPNCRPRRWVAYQGPIEATTVPPEWFGWLHFMYENPLEKCSYAWAAPYQANPTGTETPYLPTNHPLYNDVETDHRLLPYEAWKPAPPEPILSQ